MLSKMKMKIINKILSSDVYIHQVRICKVVSRDKLHLYIDTTKTANFIERNFKGSYIYNTRMLQQHVLVRVAYTLYISC